MGIVRDKRDKKSAYREQKVAAGSSVPQDGKGGRAGRKYLLNCITDYLDIAVRFRKSLREKIHKYKRIIYN